MEKAIKNVKRLAYMDISKGIGILCVILGHMGITSVNKIVFSFHMPLFFVISGYFLSDKMSPKEVLIKRSKQLLKPYSYTCMVVILLCGLKALLKLALGKGTLQGFVIEIGKWIYAALYGAGTLHETPIEILPIGAIWFLLALICGSYLTQYARQKNTPIAWIIGIACAGYFTSKVFWFPWSIQAAMTATVFIYLGSWLKNNNLLEKCSRSLYVVSLVIWINEIICGKPNLSIVRNYYPNGVFDFIGGAREQFVFC